MSTSPVLQQRIGPDVVALGRPIAITHVITTLSAGGAEMMLYRLLCAMDRSRFRNSVISLGGEGIVAQRLRAAGFPVRALGLGRAQALKGVIRLAQELRADPPDVIQTWMYHADLCGGLASLALSGIPVAWNIRCGGLDPSIDKRSTIWISRICAVLSRVLPDRIVSCSHAGGEVHAAAGYSRKNMRVIHNGFDVDQYRPDGSARAAIRKELGVGEGTLLIGAVGRFDRAKDHATLIEAAATVARTAQVHLAICGEGITDANSNLTGLLRAAGFGERCHLLGRRNDVPRFLAALDVFISSSAVEGFPNAVGEAMACGVPCVVTDAGDSRRLVGETGIVVPVRDPDALAAGVRQLVELGAEGRAALGAIARRRVRDLFGIAGVARQYEDLYREMTAACAA